MTTSWNHWASNKQIIFKGLLKGQYFFLRKFVFAVQVNDVDFSFLHIKSLSQLSSESHKMLTLQEYVC